MKAKCLLAWTLVAGALLVGGLPARAVVGVVPVPRVRSLPPAGWMYQWIAPVYQVVREQLWIPERVEMVRDWVEVAPGRFEQVLRPVITPGHFETLTRSVMVSEGYWQLVRVDPPMPMPMPVPMPVVVGPGTVGVNGYLPGVTEDLSPFSSLREWPTK